MEYSKKFLTKSSTVEIYYDPARKLLLVFEFDNDFDYESEDQACSVELHNVGLKTYKKYVKKYQSVAVRKIGFTCVIK